MTMRRKAKGPPKLPARQLAILAICRFAEPVALTSVFPYLPEMIESFGIKKKEVAKWAGITSAAFSLSQCLTAIMWGRASDKFGRKPTILTGLTCTMCAALVWGMSTTLPMAIVARAIAGACNGNVGVIRTMVAEMVPEKELQPRAFSIMPLVWSLGSIFGPSFGGFFAKPTENLPALFGNSKFLNKFPFALPNIVASGLFMIGITTGFLFLKETLESKQRQTDYGRVLGQQLSKSVKTLFRRRTEPSYHSLSGEPEAVTLLRPPTPSTPSIRHSSDKPQKPPLSRPTLSEVFTRQSVINLVAYTFLALHSMAYDQLLPIFMHHPRQVPNEHNTHLPFKFSGGFGLGSSRIGTLFTMYGVIGCFIQFLIFPPTARRFGVLNCFKGCALTFPIICCITPYTALIQHSTVQQGAMFAIMIVKSFAVIFAFPCSIILLTNSAASLRVLGTLNGFAVSISAVGRAIGPALGGACFSWGLEIGYVVVAWWVLGIISLIGAIPIWYLVEMPGFEKVDSDDEEEDEDLLPNVIDGGILEGDEIEGVGEEAVDVIEGPPLGMKRRSRGNTITVNEETGRRSYEHRERRMSEPLGGSVGPGFTERRLSSGLGVSNSGQGTGGTSFA